MEYREKNSYGILSFPSRLRTFFKSIDTFLNPFVYLISSYIGVVFILRLYLYIIDIARKDVNGLFYFLLNVGKFLNPFVSQLFAFVTCT